MKIGIIIALVLTTSAGALFYLRHDQGRSASDSAIDGSSLDNRAKIAPGKLRRPNTIHDGKHTVGSEYQNVVATEDSIRKHSPQMSNDSKVQEAEQLPAKSADYYEEPANSIYSSGKYSLPQITAKFTASTSELEGLKKFGKIESLDCVEDSCTMKIRHPIENQNDVQPELIDYYMNHKEFGKFINIEGVADDPTLTVYRFSNEEGPRD